MIHFTRSNFTIITLTSKRGDELEEIRKKNSMIWSWFDPSTIRARPEHGPSGWNCIRFDDPNYIA